MVLLFYIKCEYNVGVHCLYKLHYMIVFQIRKKRGRKRKHKSLPGTLQDENKRTKYESDAEDEGKNIYLLKDQTIKNSILSHLLKVRY